MIFAQCFNRSSSLSLARPSPNAWFGAPRMLAINVQKDDIRICQIDIWDLSVSFSFLMEWIQEIDGNRANSWFNGYFWRGPCGEHVWLFHVRCFNLLQFRLIFQELPNSTVQHSGDLTYNKDGDPRSTGWESKGPAKWWVREMPTQIAVPLHGHLR